MQSKTFSRLTLALAIIVTAFVLVYIARKGMAVIPAPEFPAMPTTTPASSFVAPIQDPYFIAESPTSTEDEATSSVFVHTSKPEAVKAYVPTTPKMVTIPLRAPLGTIKAMLADTPATREQGLSDRASMAQDTGMLFKFDTPEKYGFWMKDMRFPLDFVWILPNKTVASIYRNVSPASYPHVYYSRLFVSYVLELNAGGAAKWGIATGTQLVF